MYRGMTILHFCRQQDTVALSSGEAELKSTCKTLVETLGLRTLAEFLTGEPCPMRHHVDASAAVGVLSRSGAGQLKHLAVKELWSQEVFRLPNTEVVKIPRAINPSDLLCSVARTVSEMHAH